MQNRTNIHASLAAFTATITPRKSGLSLVSVAWIFLFFAPVAYLFSTLINGPLSIDERDLIPVNVHTLLSPEIIQPTRGGDRSPYLQLSLQESDQLRFIGVVRGWEFLQKETSQIQLLALHENESLVIFVAAEHQNKDLRRIWKIQKNGQVILDLKATQRAERFLAEYKQGSANVMIFFFAVLGLCLLSIAGLRKFRRTQGNGNSDFVK